MNASRITALIAASALLLIACKGQEEAVAPQNPLLAFVPADTPYLFGNLEPPPPEVVDAYLVRFQPTLDLAQALLDDLSIEISAEDSDGLDGAALLAAVLEEVDGKLNRQGLESLGLSLEAHKAFYGMGMFPVLRIALEDPDALRAAIARIESKAGVSFPAQSAGAASYWKIAGNSQQAGLYLAILADHLAVGLFPPAAEDRFLPEFLGQSAPPQALDANRALAELNRAKGFAPHGSGYIDFRRLAAELMQPESRTGQGLRAAGLDRMPTFDAVCTSEIEGLIDKAPRLVAGMTEFTPNALGMSYQLELETGLAGQLAQLVSDVPRAEDDPNYMLSVAVGLQAGRLREFLLEKASAWIEAPLACPQLANLNTSARDLFEQINRPMPPFIGNLNGLRAKLESLDFENPAPENARGMVVLEVEKPQMLVGMAQSFVPGLEGLELEPGGDPVALPEELMSVAVDGLYLSAAMSDSALAFSMGKDQQAGLMAYLEASEDNQGSFLSMSYDMAAQLEFQSRMRDRMQDHDGASADDPQAERVLQMVREVEDSYRDMLGRAWLELRFTDAGFEIHNRMTFR